MSRFTSIIENLRYERITLIKQNKEKKARVASASKKKAPRKLKFDSPELEQIFNSMPEDCKDLIRKGK